MVHQLDKMKARDSVDTIITPEETLLSSESSSSESSGNVCLKDITVSDSQLKLLDIYNIYPVPDDPGLVPAFWTLFPREMVYKDDGILKFIDISKRMKLRGIRRISEMLPSDEIDLGFYGIDPRIMRALCDAVTNNTSIKILNLQGNWLSVDACFHLNDLLINNELLMSINLSGCQIGPRGAKRLINGLGRSQSLEYLNVSKCELGDEGGSYICDGICDSMTMKTLDLSDNNLLGDCAKSLYYMMAQTETLEEINLSWNLLDSEEFWKIFVEGFFKNNSVTKLDLSWNSLGKKCIPFLIKLIEKSNLTELNLSNNRFDNEDLGKISKALSRNFYLQYLYLQNNPVGSEGASAIIKSLISENSQLRHLDLDNIWANKDVISFMKELERTKPSLTVKLGGILSNYDLVGPDPKKIFLKRANFEAMKPKKKKQRKDFGQFVLTLEDSVVSKIEFQDSIKRFKLKLTDSLVTEIMNAFEIGGNDLDQTALKKFYLQEYPDTKPAPPKPQKTKKGKKGKQKEDDGIEEDKPKKKVRMMEPEAK